MDKKDLKMYEAPVMESVEVELEGTLLDASFEPMPEVPED